MVKEEVVILTENKGKEYVDILDIIYFKMKKNKKSQKSGIKIEIEQDRMREIQRERKKE